MMEATDLDAVSGFTAGEEVEDFARYLDACVMASGPGANRRERLFKLVDQYYEYAQDHAASAREKLDLTRATWAPADDMDVDPSPATDPVMRREQAEASAWEDEYQTWDLLRRILPLRYGGDRPADQQPNQRQIRQTDPSTRQEYWNEFMLSDSRAQEKKAVLDWLQINADECRPSIDDMLQELQENAERGEMVAHGWLHTRSAIKQQKRITATSNILDPKVLDASGTLMGANISPMVTQLDPDAMQRQDRRLAVEDEAFDRYIWTGCFELLRRGKSMDDIRDWCSERNEDWRAATIAPLPLSCGGDEDWEEFDPDQIILWRRMCYSVVREGTRDGLERAVYGILSGDISSVEAIVDSWDDYMFAHFNAILRAQFDQFLVHNFASSETELICDSLPSFDVTRFHGKPDLLARDVVRKLENSHSVGGEARRPIKALQGAIIADTVDEFFFQQGLAIAEEANSTHKSKLIPPVNQHPTLSESLKYVGLRDCSGVRILSHILIIYNLFNELEEAESEGSRHRGPHKDHREVQSNVIAAYSSMLRLADLHELIPLYASRLVGKRRYRSLSGNLIGVEGDMQLTLLDLVQRHGLDAGKFVATQPDFFFEDVTETDGLVPARASFRILKEGPPQLRWGREIKSDFVGGDDEEALDREDELLIRSLEWMMLVEGLLEETCMACIRLYKYFSKNKHLNAARFLADRVRLVEIVKRKAGIAVSHDDDPSWFETTFGPKPEGKNRRTPTDDLEDETIETIKQAGLSVKEFVTIARTLWDFECLARTLENIDTVAAFIEIQKDSSGTNVGMMAELSKSIRILKTITKPLVQGWLLDTPDASKDYLLLRITYLPDTIIAYLSSLQFAGTTLSRENMLEAMELAAIIAAPPPSSHAATAAAAAAADDEKTLAGVFVRAGRMRELFESLTSCSKTLAIWQADRSKGSSGATGANGGSGAMNKRAKEVGWSRDVWGVKVRGMDQV